MNKTFYGMHFCPGVAEYENPRGASKRIFVGEEAIRRMDCTFAGKPIFINHVDKVDGATLQRSVGRVVRSFYNAVDGKHWVEFQIDDPAGMRAIERGLRLSNAYHPTRLGPSGRWLGVNYDAEILNGEFEHLALVDNPRYNESIVLSPEQFAAHCRQNEKQLAAAE